MSAELLNHPIHPAAGDYPLMSEAELDALAKDIAANGQIVPIFRFRGEIIDGRNRLLACRKAGVEPWIEDHEGEEKDIPTAIASFNEHRRHLSHEWLKARRTQRVTRVAEARVKGESLRTIAEREGVSPEQVRRDLESATVAGVTVEPEGGQITGRDKKTRATKPRQSSGQTTTTTRPASKASSSTAIEALESIWLAAEKVEDAGGIEELAKHWTDPAIRNRNRLRLEMTIALLSGWLEHLNS